MKRTILVIISIILILAAGFGFYAAYTGLEDVPGIQRNKNLQAADIEDAIDLIDENLDEYNEMIALQEEIDKAKAEEEAAKAAEAAEGGVAATSPDTPAVAQTPARVSICKPQRALAPSVAEAQDQYNRAQQNVNNCQAAYDAASQKVADSQAQLDAAQENLSANQAKANSISNSVNNANNAYNEYVAAQEKYNSIPNWLYSSKSAAKTEMNSKETTYRASLGSYSSIGEMNNALAAANQNVSNSKNDVSNAGQKLASDQQALNAAKSNLDSANSQLSSAKSNLSAAQSAQNNSSANNTPVQHNNNNTNTNNSIIGNLINKVDDQNKDKDKDKEKEEAEKREKDAQETAEKLKKLKEYDDVKALVEDGTEILLDNEEIASRVTDKEDIESILEASREYLEETNASVNAELTLRQQLYFALEIISIVGAVVGLLGILASIFPKRFLFVLALITSLITALSAIAMNVYGYLGGYLNFQYARVNGNGDGQLQLYAMLAMVAASLLAVIVIALCKKSFKKALKKREMREHLIRETEEAAKRRAAKNI